MGISFVRKLFLNARYKSSYFACDKFRILMGIKYAYVRNASRGILKYENKFYRKII